MKEGICKNSNLKGKRIRLYNNRLTTAVNTITNVVAIPIEIAEDDLLDTPMKGHIPKKYDKTKLFTNAAEINIISNSILNSSFFQNFISNFFFSYSSILSDKGFSFKILFSFDIHICKTHQ